MPDELEQVMRLARFRQAHPGEQVITRYTLGQLLDELTGEREP
ncbi:MAG TPA: hypothetical protein VFW64_16775 [Pseudonocardiaceae bacterium]|nr:hypothetical protein [Pseudonocardiaceae bacterium]